MLGRLTIVLFFVRMIFVNVKHTIESLGSICLTSGLLRKTCIFVTFVPGVVYTCPVLIVVQIVGNLQTVMHN